MPIEVETALISMLGVALPTIIATVVTNSATRKIMEYRLDILERKQDKYNHIIERTYKLEQTQAVHAERLSQLESHIDKEE